MLISHLLQKQKKNLTFLSRSEENVELVIDQIKTNCGFYIAFKNKV